MRKTLPPFYYLDHFNEFLTYFDGENARLLPAAVADFIHQFRSLNKSEQAVMVRVANRKYPIVAIKTLHHDEIDLPHRCIDKLKDRGLLSSLLQAPMAEIAQVLTKPELFALIREAGIPKIATSTAKDALSEYVAEHVKPSQIDWDNVPYVYRQFDHYIRFLLFVYFGHLNGRLNQFSLRDLGVMRTRSDAVTGEARFDDALDAQNAFNFALRRQQLKDKQIHEPPDLTLLPEVSSAEGKRQKSRYLYEVGKAFLPTHRTLAMQALELSESEEATEKWIRETYKDGNKEQVELALARLIASTESEKLLLFAEDFYARKFKQKRTSSLTDMLRSATKCIGIDSQYNQQVEQGVVDWHQRHNAQGWRTENQLWRSLFALTFWPILYEQDHSALSNEFERHPPVLRHNQFYQTHGEAIDSLLAQLSSSALLFKHVIKQATQHFGKSNSLFMWRQATMERLNTLINHAPLASIKGFLLAMSKDFSNLADGYPDIMVLADNKLHFEEIKAPGDKLRRNQLVAIQALKKHGFDVQVTQVEWVRDPLQPYVVVDIETTGGQGNTHRITEVGMVKVIDGKVVDNWQSLINPSRHIPAAITRLTGIDDNMVADAPLFQDVAEQIDTFTRGAIFVAHNVNFDLGFIKNEFARLDMPYRRPKLCTVQMMRKTHPGLKSYSLAALTDYFDISMTRHHRAMSDAIAAAELLQLALNKENETAQM